MTERSATGSVPTAMKDSGSSEQGYRVLSYLISGPLLYGGLGWLVDRYLHTSFLLPVGIVVGTALSVILIIRRYGQVH